MPSIFGNGIKFVFLLLLTVVYSRNHYKQQSYRYQQREDDGSDWDQYYHNQIQLDPDQTERHQSHRNHLHLYQQDQNRIDRSPNQIYSDKGKFLSRLLNSNKKPIVVFISPNNHIRESAESLDESKELLIPTSPAETKELYIPTNQANSKYVPSSPAENDAYILYNVLRTTQQDEDLDADAYEQFEKTKDMLRSAFALRCGKKAACERKCPDKKPECPKSCEKVEKVVKKECKQTCPGKPRQCERKCEKVVQKKVDECEKKVDECEEDQEEEEEKCESKCQQDYDELDACPKPKKPKCGPKCGKTLPPSWLLRYL